MKGNNAVDFSLHSGSPQSNNPLDFSMHTGHTHFRLQQPHFYTSQHVSHHSTLTTSHINFSPLASHLSGPQNPKFDNSYPLDNARPYNAIPFLQYYFIHHTIKHMGSIIY